MSDCCPSCGCEWDEPTCDVMCHRHQQPLATEGASYCLECEPPEREWEPATPAYDREAMAHIQRTLK